MDLWDSFTGALGSAWDEVTSWFGEEATEWVDPDAVTEWVDPDAPWLEGLEGGFDYWGAADETADYFAEAGYTGTAADFFPDATPSFFDQVSGLFSSENLKKGAGKIAKEIAQNRLSARQRGATAQDRARRTAADVLGSGRGVGVSGTAASGQFTPGSVQSLISRTNAGKVAFQPGTIDTRQNLVNVISEAFTDLAATRPTGAGKISTSASKIEKVGTSYFS